MNLWDFLVDRREVLVFQGFQHASMVAQCLVVATLLALVVAVLVQRNRHAVGLATATSAVALTIPSFALLGLLIAPLGIGVAPAVTAVVFYASLPILRNAVVGLAGVDPALVDAARGMGMGRLTTLVRVEIPLAWPVILAGIRVSTQMVMGIAAIAAYVSGPGLGGLIFTGLSRLGGANSVNSALAGTLGVVVLALIFDGILVLVGKYTTSRGIRV
ncbi:osmoprotectant transport system permease protein [Actinopolymorpha cephalotaxi]|uniref:Osmoprotectant transport system permease protein n=1 Tax=Actinopolymorpha cephalotaxi TaxID=504797 RepID=A0A1I2Q242_9ACTN|nr:ABC transporter permease [Actinopolymorpha cephalotaxi]NYH83449.1 osmoprotectant transport system permease protein [Actinopolymorpha cephalotaxi]SFG20307.1 osmoprotectant transport system permease protein [Actinopolymorpha cephalotaxi]